MADRASGWEEAMHRDRSLNVQRNFPAAQGSATMRLPEFTMNPNFQWPFAAGPTEWSL